MLEIIRTCDELKRRDYFTEAACAELARPMAEHVLEQAAGGGWDVRPLQFGPPRMVDASHDASGTWIAKNPYAGQSPWIRIRAGPGSPRRRQRKPRPGRSRPRHAFPARRHGVAGAGPNRGPVARRKRPDGGGAFCYRAENRGKAVSGWSRLTLALPKPLDLTRHRRLGRVDTHRGAWRNSQRAAGRRPTPGAIIISRSTAAAGGTSCSIRPRTDRFYDYGWPYSFTDLMYTCWNVYNGVKHVHLYYNGLPPGSKTACWIGRIEALEERRCRSRRRRLETGGQKIVFPVSLKPDEYLEMDFTGRCRHFDPNGGVLGDVKPEGSLRLAPGENRCVSRAHPARRLRPGRK